MSEKTLVQIIRQEPARRQYTLTSQMRLDHFMDYLTSELRSLDLMYNRFKELGRNYNAISNEAPLMEEEKRDLAYNAVVRATPDLRSVNFITQGLTGNRLKYDRIKALVVQQEAEKSMDLKVEPTAFHTKRQDLRKRNYSYNDRSYQGGESTNSSRITSYACGKPGHIKRNCPTRLKLYHQKSSSKYSSLRQQIKYGPPSRKQ
ncbi:hypothetical protein M0802_016599 [Mischocyttarus mexicanus]|nr:hypothetical protein M0802_016599 [Mischocyttarus mexicanus]